VSAGGSAAHLLAERTHLGVDALSPERVQSNAELVVQYAEGTADGQVRPRVALFENLNRLQPYAFRYAERPARPVLSFGDEADFRPETLSHLMLLDGPLPEGWQYTPAERVHHRDAIAEARAIVGKFAPGTVEGLDLLVGEIVFGQCPDKSGGSLSDVIGVIWLGPKTRWTSARYAETLAHEYTHHALFLEDMTRGIFSRTVPEMDSVGLVHSALLQRPRGYDKSFHSALVSAVMMQLADRMDAPPSSYRGLVGALSRTLDELSERSSFLTDNGKEVLAQMRQLVTSMVQRWSN